MRPDRFERLGVGGVSGLVPVKYYPRDEAKLHSHPSRSAKREPATDSLTGLTLPGPFLYTRLKARVDLGN